MEDNDLVNIRKRLHQLGLTPFFQSEPPTPYEEAIRQIWYLENVFFEACSALGARVANALGRPNGEGLNMGMLRIGFWPGGDRDGNPYVGADTTLRVARKLKLTLLRCYRKELREMRRLVTFKGLEGELDMLQSMIEEAIFNSSDLSLKQEVLLEGLGRLERRVEEEFNGLYLDQIRQLMFKVRMFGMHFASLDIRQDARVVKKAFLALLEAQSGAAAVAAFESMSEAEALDFLFAYDQPHNGTLEEDRHQDVLDSLRAMQEIQRHNGEAGCHRFILSNCAGALDIAILHAMVKASGWEGPMTLDLVPLFESIQDLDGAKAEMAKLYTHPVYAAHLDTACRRPNGHAWFFGRHQGRRLPPGQLGDLPGQAKPDRHQPRTRTHGDVLRRSWRPPRPRWRQHPPLLRVVGTRHRKPRNPNDHPGTDHLFQLWHSEVGRFQPGIAVHGRGEEPFV